MLVFACVASATALADTPAPPQPASKVTSTGQVASAAAAKSPSAPGANAGKTAAPSAALLEYLGEFSDNNGEWTDPASLDDSGLLDRPDGKQDKGRSDNGTAQN